jgi:hypothetical protein
MMPAAVTTETVAEPTETQGHAAHCLRDRGVHPRGVEDPPEPAAGADNEQHAGDRRQRLFGEGKNAIAAEAARGAEGDECQERRQQHGHQRRAREFDRRAHSSRRQHGLRQSGREHQQHRHQDRQQCDRQRRRWRRGRAAGELRGDGAGLGRHTPDDEPREQRPGDHRSWEADNQRIQQGASRIGLQLGNRGHRARVGWHQAVGGREAGHERQPEPQQGNARLLHDREQHGGEQHQADLKEHRQPDHETRQHHCPVQPTLAQRTNQRGRDHCRPAGFGQQLADDRSQSDHHRHESQRVADAGLKTSRDVGERHAGGETDGERTGGQCEKSRQSDHSDQDDHQGHAKDGNQEKTRGIGEHGSSLQSLVASP